MAQDAHQFIHFLMGIVEGQRRADAALQAKVPLRGQRAVMPGAHSDAMLVEVPRDVVIRHARDHEREHTGFILRRADGPQAGRDFWKAQVYIEQSLKPRFPDVNVVDLREAWADIMKRAKLVQHHKISRGELSVREHMSIVLRNLQGRRFAMFEDLFDVSRGPQVLVVTFIAML